MSAGGFGPRFVPSTAARRFVFVEDEQTELIPDRLLRDRADTVRVAPPRATPLQLLLSMPMMAKLILAGVALGAMFALVYAYRPPID